MTEEELQAIEADLARTRHIQAERESCGIPPEPYALEVALAETGAALVVEVRRLLKDCGELHAQVSQLQLALRVCRGERR